MHTLIKFNPDWLSQQPVLITQLRKIWAAHPMLEKRKKLDGSNDEQWREIKLLAKCLLSFVKHRLGEIDVLFQLLRVYTVRSIPSFHFLKKFLEDICKVRLFRAVSRTKCFWKTVGTQNGKRQIGTCKNY